MAHPLIPENETHMPKSRADLAVPDPPPRTFDEAFAELNLTADERSALVWRLAEMRTRKLIETLLPSPDYGTVNEEHRAELLKMLRGDEQSTRTEDR